MVNFFPLRLTMLTINFNDFQKWIFFCSKTQLRLFLCVLGQSREGKLRYFENYIDFFSTLPQEYIYIYIYIYIYTYI